jgi:hypothetical protein
MTVQEIATALRDDSARVIIIYGFNSTGKTKLSVAYKNATKSPDGTHAGVYYNAYSEDLFVWDNDMEHGEANVSLTVKPCRLNELHGLLTEESVRAKLIPYKPKYDFGFRFHDDIEFYPASPANTGQPIKVSRGEERIFVWCFFLALFDVEGWADRQSAHFFIDDPVSSLDEHNIFVTASTLFELIEEQHETRKIIITTHHIGLFSILFNWLKKGEKAERYKKRAKLCVLRERDGALTLERSDREALLLHLQLMQVLERAREANEVRAFHLAILRQVLENVASFLGSGRFGHVLEQIGIADPTEVANIINVLSHKNVYRYESDMLTADSAALFDNVFGRLKTHYGFELHV